MTTIVALFLPLLLFACLTNAQEGTLSDGATTTNATSTKCKPEFEPVFSVGCNRSNFAVCSSAAKSVFFSCDKHSIAKVGDPSDAEYCSGLEIDCDETCQAVKDVTSRLADLTKINITDFIVEVIAFLFICFTSWKMSEDNDKQDLEWWSVVKFGGLLILGVTDAGLLITSLYHTGQVVRHGPTFFNAECVDVISEGGLKHHDALKDLNGTANNLFTVGWLELVFLIVCLVLDYIVYRVVQASDEKEGKKMMVYLAIFMQVVTCVMAGIDLFAFTLVAQRQADLAYGSLDQVTADSPLIGGLVNYGTALNRGLGDWCMMASNETATCLSSL